MQQMDEAQFIRVFDTTKNGLYGLFRKQGIEESQAEDMVQECYLRLWEKREGLKDPASYVFGIAFNMVREFHRQRIRVKIQQLEPIPDQEDYPGMQDNDSPEELYHVKESWRIVREVTGTWSAEKRSAFTLIKDEERSYKEAAELSGVPVSTLEKRVAVGLKILRKALT